MIRQKFRLHNYDWIVYAYYIVTRLNAREILENLEFIGCRGENLYDARKNLDKGSLNSGLTYSNENIRATVIVFAKTSTAREFQQTYQHEIGHLKDHIAHAFGLNPHGEEIQYIGDEIIERTWPISMELLCDCCRRV